MHFTIMYSCLECSNFDILILSVGYFYLKDTMTLCDHKLLSPIHSLSCVCTYTNFYEHFKNSVLVYSISKNIDCLVYKFQNQSFNSNICLNYYNFESVSNFLLNLISFILSDFFLNNSLSLFFTDANGKIRIWDTVNPEHCLAHEYQPLGGAIKDIAWSPDSKRIVVGGDGREK